MRYPFYESIVRAISCATTIKQMRLIDLLINQTKIPQGHDNIASAWIERMKWWPGEESLMNGVLDCLEKQKRETEEEDQRRLASEVAEIARDAREDCN